MTVNRAMALRVVWGTRIDDDTPADDARDLLEMCGLVEPGGHELLPDLTATGRLIDEQGRPVATAPRRRALGTPDAGAKKKGRPAGSGRKPIPIEHGTDHGYQQHKAKKVAIPADDACGCQAAHNARLKRPARRAPTEPAPDLEPAPEAATRVGTPTAEQIRAQVDAMAERVRDDGSINAQHVAIEQTLRTRHGLPSYIANLDGPGKFYPAPPLAPWEEALVADPFDPNDPRLTAVVEDVGDGITRPPHFPASPGITVPPPGSKAAISAAVDRPTPPPDPGRQPPVVPTSPTDLDEWLAGAQRSRRPAVRQRAQTAVLKLLQLRCALDDLARAEREAR